MQATDNTSVYEKLFCELKSKKKKNQLANEMKSVGETHEFVSLRP